MPSEFKVFTLNSFTDQRKGGNPAGVVLNADALSTKQMQKIAKKVGFSETAFVCSSKKADFKLRFFTPLKEVDLCGHATIASFYLLSKMRKIRLGNYFQETKAGVLKISVEKGGKVFMHQNLPKFFPGIPKNEIVDSLNISEKTILTNPPNQIVSTGERDVFVGVRNLKTLLSLKPNFEKIKKASRKHKIVGFHVFNLQNKGLVVSCRDFAPLFGIREDPATGIATGALACYLFAHKKITKKQAKNLVFEQGRS